MTLYQFNQLNITEQEESIAEEGVYLSTRDEGELMYDLYQMGTFYIEFMCNIGINNHRLKIRCFTDTDELLPYLKSIDITRLL